ncbi:MAG: D-alanine--D-alanine ligase family protein, partial [bacterium]
LGVKTPQFMVIRDIKQSLNDCPLPAVVKPLYEGSSMGIRLGSKVDTPEELEKKVRQIIQAYKEPVLVEKFLPGSEFTVGVLGDGRGLELIGVMEIVPKGMKVSEFLYSIEVKRNWRQMVEYVVNPHWFSGRIKDRIKSDVLKIAETLGIVDFARFDFRFDENGEPNFLEVNPLPGLNPIQSDFPMLARAVGINYDELIIRIIESARKRYVFENSDSIQQGLKKSVG